MEVIKPPTNLYEILEEDDFSLFAGGSIEQGTAYDWQADLDKELKDVTGKIFNPRRDDWDASLEQRISNPVFMGQLEWEYLAMELADKLLFYFDPKTKSPITIGEVYMLAPTVDPADIAVICPDGFWRKGNIEFICGKFGVPLFHGFYDALDHLFEDVDEKFLPVKKLTSI
jgi:hypothetical protein